MPSHVSGTLTANESSEEFVASEVDVGFRLSGPGCFRVEVQMPDDNWYTYYASEQSGMVSVRLRNDHKMKIHLMGKSPATATYSITGNFVD